MNKSRKRLWTGLILFVAILISLPILLTVIENFRGAKEWQRVEKELVAAGISLDPKSYLLTIPNNAEQNFGKLPLVASIFDFPQAFEVEDPDERFDEEGNRRYANPDLHERFVRMTLPVTAKSNRDAGLMSNLAQMVDDLARHEDNILTLPESGTPAERLLSAMHAESGDDLAAIDRAARRPFAIAGTEIGEDFLENLSIELPFAEDLRLLVQYQRARAIAALENGDPDQAVAAVRVIVACGRLAGSHPLLITYLVELTFHQIAFSTVWQGIETNSWESAHYLELQEILSGVDDLFERGERAITFETVCFQIEGSNYMRDNPEAGWWFEQVADAGRDERRYYDYAFRLIPDGTFDFIKSLGCELVLKHAILPLRQRDPAALRDEIEFPDGLMKIRSRLIAMTLPAVTGVTSRTFRFETVRRQTITSCAVERYRLANNGKLPGELSDLVPGYLPAIPEDPMNPGSPLQYRKTVEGYKIYSFGPDGIDDGGTSVWRTKTPDPKKGDWVWGIPAEKNPADP